MTAAQPQITHESQTQRQHARLPVPAKAKIGGRVFAVRDLSPAGAAIENETAQGATGIANDMARGQRVALTLDFSFGGWNLSLPLEAEVRHHGSKTTGLLFTRPGAQQADILGHIVRAFIAGDVLSSGDLLSVAKRDNTARPRKAAEPPVLKKQLTGLFLILCLGLAAAAVLLGNIYMQLFVVTLHNAAVAGPAATLRAPQDGVFIPAFDTAAATLKQGETAFTFMGADGTGQTIASPCDCLATGKIPGGAVPAAAGDTLLTLAPFDAEPWIRAETDPETAAKISPGDGARVTVAGIRQPFEGKIADLRTTPPAIPGMPAPVVLTIETAAPIPPALLQRPATVEVFLR